MGEHATQSPSQPAASGPQVVAGGARLQVCGPLAVEIGGERLEAALPGRRGRQLVAYLAVNRHRAVRRDELIDALWPADPPVNPEGAFATLLTRTRAALGHAVVAGGAHLRLELGQDPWIDWEVAHRGATDAAQARAAGDAAAALRIAEEALAIVEQGFLPDADGAWLEERRRELDELRVELCDVLARAALELGGDRLAAAERAARTIVERSPFRESGHALLIEALSAGGNDAEALRTFDRLRTLLREQLGLTPSPAVTALAERLLQRAPSPQAPPIAPPPALADAARRPFAGRAAERRRLLALADAAARGDRRVALVSGEPGIGKTRLLAQVADELSRRGWRALYGRADRDSAIAYQPLMVALHARDAPAVAELLGRSSPSGDPDLERFRLFEEVAGLAAAASADRPAVLVLDDLHWADRSTLLLLAHVVRATAGCRLLLLASYRDLEEEMGEPLRELLDTLWHAELYDRVPLRGLALAETGALVGGHVPDAAPELVARLHERTGGNPFYVEELLRGLAELHDDLAELPADGDFPVPERVQQMIVWRVARLPSPAPEVLRAAAVLGGEFDAGRAAAVAQCPLEAALRSLEHAHRAGLVVAAGERVDGYAFRHGLVREALLEATPPGRRARIHLAVAELLEAADGTDPAELALHWWEARNVGGAERAVHWRLEAAAEATCAHAHEEALRHLRHALQALALLAPDGRLRARIILAEGQALVRAGEVAAGRERLAEAAELARRLGAVDLLADAVLDAGAFYMTAGRTDRELIDMLEEARAGLAGEQAPADRARLARVTGRLAVALYWDPDRRAQLGALADEAVRIATDSGDARAIAFAYGSRHCAHWVSEDAPALLDEAEAAIELAQYAHDAELEFIARTWRVNHLLTLARVEQVDAEIERFSALAERMRQSRCGWYAPLFRAARALMSGRLDEAERLIVSAAELGSRIPDSPAPLIYGSQLFALRSLQGRLAELEPAIAALVERYPAVPAWIAALAQIDCAAGRHAQARARLDALVAADLAAVPHDNLWLVAVTALGDVCADTGAHEHAAALERALTPSAGLCAIIPTAAWLGPVDRVLGRLATLQGHWEEASGHLARASLVCGRASCPAALVEVRLDQADMLLRRGRPSDVDAARAAARAALGGAETIGMRAATGRAVAILARTDPRR